MRSTREQFGRPLCEFQGLQWKFAEMAIKLEGAQLLLYRAAANADRGLPSAYETAVAKAACNQAGFEVAHEAVQAMGAIGYSRETLVEYCMRRCRGWMIAGGSIEILKNRIAEHVFDRRFDQRRPQAECASGGVTHACLNALSSLRRRIVRRRARWPSSGNRTMPARPPGGR